MGRALSSGLERIPQLNGSPGGESSFLYAQGRSSPFAELCFGILGSGPPAFRRIHLSRRLELEFWHAYSLAR